MGSIAVVGAGLSGLRCATLLQASGHDVQVYERSSRLGGRMQTDQKDGFLLDHGFHVMQTGYPASKRTFNFQTLGAHAFEPGAILVEQRKKRAKFWTMADPFRRPLQGVFSGLNRFASPLDLLRVAMMRFAVRRGNVNKTFEGGMDDTRAYLMQRGFSERMIDRFFHPLFSGIFLEDDLRTNERMFRFVFRMMSEGQMVLPEEGVAAAPKQLAQRLGYDRIHLDSTIEIHDATSLSVNGKKMKFDAIVKAYNPHLNQEKRHVWTVHYGAPSSPLKSKHILLNTDVRLKNGLIAHLAVPSDIQPSYAPAGKSLVSVTVVGQRAEALGLQDASAIEGTVRAELSNWFGSQTADWDLLDVQHIRHALPEVGANLELTSTSRNNGFECGDHTVHGSVEGALVSAEQVANAVHEHLERRVHGLD